MGKAFVIQGARVFDGTGQPGYLADVAVRGDRIVAVGANVPVEGDVERINAQGLTLAPGFIDAHTHDDRAVMATPDMAMKVSQGVTTVIGGNCGVSLAPLAGKQPPPPLNLLGDQSEFRFATMAEYFDAVNDTAPALNIAMLTGHSTLRVAEMSDLNRPATAQEIDRMGLLLDEAMAAGAIGFSTGLAYPTAQHAPTEEVIELSRRAASAGGLYATHMRDEENKLLEAVDETVRIGKESDSKVVISHHKACGKQNWGKTRESLAIIDAANAAGDTVDFDVYPYVASSTVLLKLFVARAERVMITWSESFPDMAGKDLDAIVEEWGLSLDDTIDKLQPAGAIYFQMDEGDLRRVLSHPGAMVGSDGLPHDRRPHPRLWGTFPRVLGHYSRDEGLFPLETAIHKMTGLTARVFGLEGRGVIAPDAYADLVLFNADTVIDRADFDHPTETSAGIERVFVSGQEVWRDGTSTGARPGSVIRRANR